MGSVNNKSYVSWPVTGGIAVGQVTKLIEKDFEFNNATIVASKDEPAAEVMLPSDQIVYIASNRLSEISEDEYKKHLAGLAELFTRKSGGNVNVSKELETVQAELKTAKETIEILTASKTALEANVADLTAKNTAAATELETTKADLAKITKAALAKDRFTKLAALDGVTAIDSDETKALAKLGEMTEDAFNSVLNVAKLYSDKIKASKPETSAAPVTPQANETIQAALDTATPDAKASDIVVAAVAGGADENPLITAMNKKYGIKSE
jgi:hypothetical protein